jgi:hypothetical protein
MNPTSRQNEVALFGPQVAALVIRNHHADRTVTPAQQATPTSTQGLAATRPGGVPLLVERRTGAGSHRRILRGGGDSLIHHLLLEL